MTTTAATPTSVLAADAARMFNSRALASVQETLSSYESKLADMPAMLSTAKAFEAMRPIVAPQIAPQIAETLKAINARDASFIEAFSRVEKQTFAFANTLDPVDKMLKPRVAELVQAWNVSPALDKAVATAFAGVPRTAWSDLAPSAGRAIGDAVILAEKSAAAGVAAGSLVDLDDLSPRQRRELQTNVMNAIAAAGTLVAILSRNGRVELASATLAFVAILVTIDWQLTGRLDE